MHDNETTRTTTSSEASRSGVPRARSAIRTPEPESGRTLGDSAIARDTENARAGLIAGPGSASRTLGPKLAAGYLKVRSRDLDCLVEAGLLSATNERDGGTPAFAVEDLDRVAAMTDLNWHSVRGLARSSPSPWRTLAGPVGERTNMVRALVTRLRADGVDAWARHSHKADCWTVDWTPTEHGPHRADVITLLSERLVRAVLAHRLVVLGPIGQTMHWAQEMLRPGRAIVVDTETTGLHSSARIVEIAVLDASSGAPLLNTLVDPQTPIPRAASRVHGITDAMVAGAPTWDRVLPRLLELAQTRTTLAYNEEFDRRMIGQHSRASGLNPGHLRWPESWGCLMKRRTVWMGTTSWLALGGDHRALGDATAASKLLRRLTQRPTWTHEFDDPDAPAI
ncbi:3'-5' exonuclease [Embleya sp. NBC_00896]|uniref:3'-5' exonuclease n=1 Tax=Embleya sp. NBC_00896 TaxID=2975961 RepID=UPI002F90ACE6|nr:3'-5' exonuclease [Embleya sp. NBC_00896]